MKFIAGVDEVGRGPLAGPVTAAAVIFAPDRPHPDGVMDSKKLSAGQREQLAVTIKETAYSWALGWASVEEIEQLNIFWASLLAMQRAVAGLAVCPDEALIDGAHTPELPCPARAIIKGDSSEPAISAASIIAKVARDQLMCELDMQYPQYGFAQHKGYPTKRHIMALEEHGVTPIHRKGYRPVQEIVVRSLKVIETAI